MIYGVTIGSGKLAKMALCQLRSIHEFTPVSRESIVANCPPNEWAELTQPQRDEILKMAIVRNEEPPIPDYPLSAFQATGRACVDHVSDDDWFVLLDTDILVLRHVSDVFDSSYDLGLKPADFHYESVGMSETMLQKSFNIAKTSLPSTKFLSTVDNKPIPPYWNGGVVFISNPAAIERWIELNSMIHSIYPNEFFIEQIGLSILSTEFIVSEMTELVNFPLSQRLWTPSSTYLLHYHDPVELRWVMNPIIYKKLDCVEINDSFDFGGWMHQAKRLGIRIMRLRLRF